MTIGPAPMIRMLFRSVRLGIRPPAGPSQGRPAPPRGAANECERGGPSLLLHQRHETVKEVADVVRPWTGLRMALEAERRLVGARKALQRAVEQRHVGRAQGRRQSLLVDREAVV